MSIRVPFTEVEETCRKAFVNIGVPEDKAQVCARIHTESSADGVESHGLNRIPRFAEYVQKGLVDVHAISESV